MNLDQHLLITGLRALRVAVAQEIKSEPVPHRRGLLIQVHDRAGTLGRAIENWPKAFAANYIPPDPQVLLSALSQLRLEWLKEKDINNPITPSLERLKDIDFGMIRVQKITQEIEEWQRENCE